MIPTFELPKKRHHGRNISLVVLVTLIAIGLGAVLFVRYDTTAAANFTDNVLRPILGDTIVLGLEKTYFNVADKAQQVAYSHKDPNAPQFVSQSPAAIGIAGGSLNLEPIPPNSAFTPLRNEGIWFNQPMSQYPGQQVAAHTFVRPDATRSYAIVTILQLDMSKFQLGAVAGTKQPGGSVGKPGPGIVPQTIIDSGTLAAAFDGGFQYRDGEYGMIVGGTTYLPLKNDLGTIVGYTDGSMRIMNYTGQSLGPNVAFVRQNCPILIENGALSVSDEKNKALWGRTLSSSINTWRSGIGITKNGDLLFAVGNNLTPTTLAAALQSAGAVNAIQLDINPVWVRFNLFTSLGQGQYSSTTLTKALKDGSKQYLTGYTKDFFYLFKRP